MSLKKKSDTHTKKTKWLTLEIFFFNAQLKPSFCGSSHTRNNQLSWCFPSGDVLFPFVLSHPTAQTGDEKTSSTDWWDTQPRELPLCFFSLCITTTGEPPLERNETQGSGQGQPWGSVEEPACQCRRRKFDPGVRKIPREGHGNPLQYPCLRIPWTEEPEGVQSMGLQRDGQDWARTRRSVREGAVGVTGRRSRKENSCHIFPNGQNPWCAEASWKPMTSFPSLQPDD